MSTLNAAHSEPTPEDEDGSDAAATDPEIEGDPPRIVGGRYRIERRLGVGGMGEVFQAWDERLFRSVALKQIRPDSHGHPKVRRRFLREARAAARLDHPAIARVYDLLEAEGSDWIVMELALGRSIDDMVRDEPLDLLLALSFAVQIADGLATAHDHGIVHRDLKSENVVLTSGGRLKILDFGLSKPLDSPEIEAESGSALSRAGQLIGTPRAMSPEQARGYAIDTRSDLFSLGSLLYEMLTGTMPFDAPSPLQALTRVCTYDPPPPSRHRHGVSPAVDELVARLLAKDPDDRPQHARDALLLLQDVAASVPGTLDDTVSTGFVPIFLPARSRPAELSRGWRWFWIFAAGVAFGAALGVAVAGWLVAG